MEICEMLGTIIFVSCESRDRSRLVFSGSPFLLRHFGFHTRLRSHFGQDSSRRSPGVSTCVILVKSCNNKIPRYTCFVSTVSLISCIFLKDKNYFEDPLLVLMQRLNYRQLSFAVRQSELSVTN